MSNKDTKQPRRNPAASATDEFIRAPVACRLLDSLLPKSAINPNVALEELAAWVFLGSALGGLDAYLYADALSPPPKFHFDDHDADDYLSPLTACWFRRADVERFRPQERFIPGAELLERWKRFVRHDPSEIIRTAIGASRLIGIHPAWGVVGREIDPPLDTGLFSVSNVLEIEQQDFAEIGIDAPRPKVKAVSKFEERCVLILSALEEIGVDPQALPPYKEGTSGTRRACWDRLTQQGNSLRFGTSTKAKRNFYSVWQSMRDKKILKDAL